MRRCHAQVKPKSLLLDCMTVVCLRNAATAGSELDRIESSEGTRLLMGGWGTNTSTCPRMFVPKLGGFRPSELPAREGACH